MTTAHTHATRILFAGAALALLAAAGCGELLGDLDGAHLADASTSCVACGRRDGGPDGGGETGSTSGGSGVRSSGSVRESGTPSTQPQSSAQRSGTAASSGKSSGTATVPSSSEPQGSSTSNPTKSSSGTTSPESSAVTSTSSTATTGSNSSDVDAGAQPFDWDTWPIPNDPSDVAAGAPHPESYTSHGDGTVTDNVTGLMWQQATGQDGITYAGAISRCSSLSLAGYTDWRLPTIMELVSLLDFDDQSLTDSTTFSTLSATSLWSSTLVAYDVSQAWYVDLEADSDEGNGVVQAYSVTSAMNALCVR